MENAAFQTQLWGEEITAVVQRFGTDCAVTVTGGQREHVGAVSLCGPDGAVQTLTLPGHKDEFITGPWSRRIHNLTGGNVSVAAGVHYDHLSKKEIDEVMDRVALLLRQVTEYLAAGSDRETK